MAKTVFTNGSPLDAAYLNALQDIQFDGQDIDGHYPPLTNGSLSNSPGQIRYDFYTFQNALKVSHSSGLTFAYTAGSVLNNAGLAVAIAAGTITVPDNASTWIYVTQAGVISRAAAYPVDGMPLAKVTTAAGTIAGAIEDLRPRVAYPVGFLQNYLGAALTLYVSPTGTGSGLSATDPCSLAKACRLVSQINRNGWPLTIQLADGTYSPGAGYKALASIAGTPPSFNDYTPDDPSYFDIILQGNLSNPENVIFNLAALNTGLYCERTRLSVQGITFNANISALAAISAVDSYVGFQTCRFRGGFQVAVNAGKGGLIDVGACEFADASNDPNYAFSAGDGGIVRLKSGVCVLTGTPTFTAFALATAGGQIKATGMTFSGSANGSRYAVANFGLIDATGKGLSYFPGSTAGSPNASGFDATTGGIYRA